MSGVIAKIASDNCEFYRTQKDSTRFVNTFQALIEIEEKLAPVIIEIEGFAADYDFDEHTHGNGYRSFTYVCQSAVRRTVNLCTSVQDGRESFFFRRGFYEKELAAYRDLLHNLHLIGASLVEVQKKCQDKSLFSEEGVADNTIAKILNKVNKEAFYGRAVMFHHPGSLKLPMFHMAVFIATYSEFYFSNENVFLKLLRFPQTYIKYLLSPSQLSKRLVNVHDHSTICFGKSLLNIFESKFYRIVQEITDYRVAVNEAFEIRPDPMQVKSEISGKMIDIPIPNSHIGVRPVLCRLFSSRRRKRMTGTISGDDGLSDCLIIHCHGGGWITQSSLLHGSYSREWAAKLDVPIISIDYSHAPEAPFPRALEEVFFVYCWALKNSKKVGSTGSSIVLVGDSAGANLVSACTAKCIEMGIRKPNGLFNIYGALEVNHVMAPSRFLGLMDVILPYKSHMRLFNAYNGEKNLLNVTENRKIPRAPEDEFASELPRHHLRSPTRTPDDILRHFPKTIVLTTNIDPCLDECVVFAKALKKADVNVKLDVIEGLNHGFLNFARVSRQCHQGSKICMKRLEELLKRN